MLKSIITFLNKSFPLLITTKEKWIFVISNGLFVLLFFNIYLPFSMDEWTMPSRVAALFSIHGFGIYGALVLMFTQFPLRKILGLHTFKYWTYGLWLIIELIFLSLTMYLIYGETKEGNVLTEFFITAKYTVMTALFSYGACLILLNLNRLNRLIHTRGKMEAPNTIRFHHENGKIGLVLKTVDVLYLKSADNYVEVFYNSRETVQTELIRNNLKWFEKNLDPNLFIRIHRSFIVNTRHISAVKKIRNSYEINIGDSKLKVSEKFRAIFEKLYIESRI